MFNKKEIELLREENTKLKQENDKLKESYGLSKSKELKEEIAKLNEQIEFLKKDNENYHNINMKLQDKLNEAERKKLSIERDFTYYENLYNKSVKLKKEQDEEIGNLYKKQEQLEEEIKKLNQDISVKNIEIETYKQAINNVSLTFQKSEKQTQPKPKKEDK